MLQIHEAELKELERLMRRAEKPHLRMKATALWNLGRGKRRREVADFLGVSPASISAWTQRFRAEGSAGLGIRPGRGRKAVANAAEVERYLRQSPRAFGLAQTRWTLSALAQVVPSLRGFQPHGGLDGAEPGGISLQTGPTLSPFSRSSVRRKKGLLEQVLQEAAQHPEEVIVLFTDEASFYRQPTQAWLWASMGRRQPRLRYSHRANTLMRVVGLLDAAKARVQVWDFPQVTAERLARCFRQIGPLYPQARRIYLVMDNWPVHTHPKVQGALAAEPRIQLIPLPTYAPWLNRIERLWRWVKQRATHAHPWCDDFLLFKQQVLAEFHPLASGSPALKRYCGLDRLFS